MDNEKNNLSDAAELDEAPKKAGQDDGHTADDVRTVMEKTVDYNEDDLNNELEKLAQTFRDELQKAKEENSGFSESAGQLIQQLDYEAGIEPIAPEDLCSCCGERRRDKSFGEDYEYCTECREAMQHYPIEFYRFVIAAAVLFTAVISVLCFVAEYDGFSLVHSARQDVKANDRTGAVENYEAAISFFEEEDSAASFVSLEAAKQIYEIMPNGLQSMKQVVDHVESALGPVSAKLPVNSSYVEMRKQSLVFSATLQAFYSIMQKEEYAGFDGTDKETYEKIMTEIGSLIDQTTLVTEIGAKDGEEISVPYDEAVVRFAQYMFAYAAGNFDDSYYYIKLVEETNPDYVWLYGYELGIIEVQQGNFDKADELADKLSKLNSGDVYSYLVSAFSERMKGNFEKSIKICDKAIETDASVADVYRQKAMACILNGDYDAAVEAVKTGISYEEYAAMYYVYYVAASEMKDTALMQQIAGKLEDNGIIFDGRMADYVSGKITAHELFAEGTGDIG